MFRRAVVFATLGLLLVFAWGLVWVTRERER